MRVFSAKDIFSNNELKYIHALRDSGELKYECRVEKYKNRFYTYFTLSQLKKLLSALEKICKVAISASNIHNKVCMKIAIFLRRFV